MMYQEIMAKVRGTTPLIHCITNYVTVNDVANVLLAAGASPIMADDEAEVEEITALCGGLAINIGTLNGRTIASMIKAGKKANVLGNFTILDPVGAGASKLRTEIARKLIKKVRFSVIRGNVSEIKTISAGTGTTKGVDADSQDAVTEENLAASAAHFKELSKRTGSIIAVTGAIDLVCDGERAYVIRNGHAMMSRITGTGCMLTGLMAAFCAANPKQQLVAAAAAVTAMGIAGEMAQEKVRGANAGTGSFRMYLIDAISNMDDKMLNGGAKVEIL